MKLGFNTYTTLFRSKVGIEESEAEEQARLKAEEEARLVEDARHEAKENEHAQLKVEEGVRLAL